MAGSRFSCVLFDFDGTLAPNLDLVAIKRAVIELSVDAGVPEEECTPRLIVEIVEHGAEWLKARGRDPENYRQNAHARIRQMELAAAEQTSLYPGVRDILKQLRQQGLALGIVTRNCHAAIQLMFPDAEEHCGSVLTRDHVQHLKPDRRHLLACLDALRCKPIVSVMVGDGLLDMSAGRALRMHCIGVLTGYNDEAQLKTAGAHAVIPHVHDLPGLLR